MAEKSSEVQKTGMFSNILAVAGLVILIAIIFWGLFHVITLSKPWFASIFSFSSKSLRVTVPAGKLPSGEQFPVAWKYNPKTAGSYAFLYQCHAGFQFKTTVADDVQTAIPCGVGYTMLSSDNTFNVTPFLTGTSSLAVPLSVIFMPSARAATGTPAAEVQGNATVTITNANPSPAETIRPQVSIPNLSTPASLSPVVETPIAPKSVPPDFSVRILSEGVIDPVSGTIVSRQPTSPGDLVAVRFLISNDGGASTGPWYFTAQLPTSPAYPYTSPAQTSLAPGASIENTLRFTQAISGGFFSVSVDPVNEVKESNEGNNTASVRI